NDEPDIHSNMNPENQIKMRGPTVYGPGAFVYNTYPLVHVCGFHQRWAAAHPDKRGFILTRSGFTGIQRCQAAVWSGDVAARWSDMREQISAGVNFSLSGIPNWTFDIGGYAVERRYGGYLDDVHFTKPKTKADAEEFVELYTRWYAFGAFTPIFRSHGEVRRREIYEIAAPGSKVFDILKSYTELRYRLLPYIYSAASETYHQAGTMMRGLVMDFPQDRKVRNIDDQYLFGRALLVAPVTEHKATGRSVYLPAGTEWYDFFTGEKFAGGQAVAVQAPLGRIPVFAKAGSILPTGPVMQYTDQKPDAPLTVVVYTGKDGRFTLYEDDGISNGYRKGRFATIAFAYDEAKGTLTIGPRHGNYDGMAKTRTIHVRFVSGPVAKGAKLTLDGKADRTVTYDGTAVTVAR
ncbi:MAG TPA: TIM-barrel domain-containing protein, partial [Rhizomicrobium sp.]